MKKHQALSFFGPEFNSKGHFKVWQHLHGELQESEGPLKRGVPKLRAPLPRRRAQRDGLRPPTLSPPSLPR